MTSLFEDKTVKLEKLLINNFPEVILKNKSKRSLTESSALSTDQHVERELAWDLAKEK